MGKNDKEIITTLDEMPFVLNVNDISRIMGISRTKAYELVNSDGFPSTKIGKRIAVPKVVFEQWLINRVKRF